VGTVATSIASCGSNNPIPTPTPTPPPSPTDYIGKWDGSDWKGHENLPGHLELGINEDGTTACIERVNGDVEFAAYNFVIPDSVYGEDGTTVYKLTKINNDAFSTAADYACLFGTLTIGNNIEEIGDSAFYQCYALTGDLIFPNSVISIGNSAFYQCSNFYGRLRFGDHVEHIGSEAFVDDNFTENLIIKNSVESVGQYAFFHTNNFAKLVFEG
jgi:hypothetical protein